MPVLSARRLGKRYGDRWVLSGIDLDLEPSDRLAILGPSGCGKTTLLNLLGGLDRPDEGYVMLENQDLTNITPLERSRVRRERIGTIFQFFHLIPTLTASENIELPLQLLGWSNSKIQERVKSLLTSIGLEARAHAWAHELSGGEQQRIAVARALASKPAVLLADEPTGNLDQTSGLNILGLLSKLATQESTALVMVTHSEVAAKTCQKILRLVDGKMQGSIEVIS
ncbi:MAG: ABC transporter ATP-binding protein [Holophagaceae bacterium]|jgi:ABC-type lipoprotein export system ATPase subunit